MTDTKLSEFDLKLWKWYTNNVTPIGEELPINNTPKTVLDFSAEVAKLANKEFKNKKKNQQGYQARLDLHGMTRDEAYRYLEVQLCIYKSRGYHCILIITGKGHGKGDGLGVLKRKVPMWLEGAKFNKIVRSHSPASQRDGGDGALYVYLR